MRPLQKHWILLTLSLAVLSGMHIGWTQDETGVLLTLDDRPVDLTGVANEHLNKLTRNCEAVELLKPADEKYRVADRLIRDYSPPDSKSATIASVWSTASWMLVEVEFKGLLPAVVLIQNANTSASIIPEAVWSGHTNPRKPAPFIRAYISDKAPHAPRSLINCFDPQSASFQS